MIGLDTNILIRYFTKDNELEWQKAKDIIENGKQCFISNIVLCEIVWVLKGKSYNFTKQEIIKILELLSQCSTFEFENRTVFYQAIQNTKKGNADFSDYLIGAICKESGCNYAVSFDQKLKNDKYWQCL